MSLSCFCTSDSCLKSLFHLKYSSEGWSYLAASLSPVQPGYTTRFAFKEGLTACPTPAVRLAVRGWLECTPLWELLRSCIWWWDNFPRPLSPPPAPSFLPAHNMNLFHVDHLPARSLYRVLRLHFWPRGVQGDCVRKKQLFFFQANLSPREAVEPHPGTLGLIDLWHVNSRSSSSPTLQHHPPLQH